MLKKYAIIVAGGSGSRMNVALPKQFLTLAGKPLLMYTLTAFHHYDPAIEIILVLNPERVSYWKRLCEEHQFTIPHRFTEGGITRFHSVRNGLNGIFEEGIVAIHDGVRPFVSAETLKQCFEGAEQHGNAIPFISLNDSIRQKEGESSKAVDRSKYVLIQTPQCFRSPIIRGAYEKDFDEAFTDDASVVEANGHRINLVPGNIENIKITTASDLRVAEAFIKG